MFNSMFAAFDGIAVWIALFSVSDQLCSDDTATAPLPVLMLACAK
jgi:hypothetical protein